MTTVVTGPGSANPIGGPVGSAMKTYGCAGATAYAGCIDDVLVAAPVAMKMALGENPKSSYHGKNQAPVTRMATAAVDPGAARLSGRAVRIRTSDRAAADAEVDEPEYDSRLRGAAAGAAGGAAGALSTPTGWTTSYTARPAGPGV